MTIYVENKISSKELFNLLVKNNIPCFIIRNVKTNEFTVIVILENLKEGEIYKYRYLNKTRIAKFKEYELSDVPNAKVKCILNLEDELIYTIEITGEIEFSVFISSYMVDKNTIEKILKAEG